MTTPARDHGACLSVVMPCFNELATIAEVVERVLASPYTGELVIVDDGSVDGTRDVLAELDDPRVRVLLQERNQGKGAALRRGFAEATHPFVIVQDADLEYDPDEYGDLLEPLLADKADVVYGSRFLGGRPHRVLYFWHSIGNRLLTVASNMFTDLNLTDMETCYKVFRREVLRELHPRGGPLRHRAGDHGQDRRRALAGLRDRHQLQRPHLRRGQEDRVEGRPAGLLLHHPLLAHRLASRPVAPDLSPAPRSGVPVRRLAQSFVVGGRRSRLRWPWRRLASSRRARAAPLGRVGRRRRCSRSPVAKR